MKDNQIRFIAARAQMLTEQGDSYLARLLLLPDNLLGTGGNYLPEAEAAFRSACNHNSAILKGHTAALNGVKYSEDGKQIVTCSYDGTLKLWDALSGLCLKTFEGHKDWVLRVDFCRGDKSIISSSRDGTVKVWDAATGKALRTIVVHAQGHEESCFVLSPDKKLLIILVEGVWKLLDGLTYKTIKTFKTADKWNEIRWFPDGKWIAVYTEDNEFIKVNVQTEQRMPIAKNYDDAVLIDMALDPKGKRVAGVFGYHDNRNGYSTVWDVKTGKKILMLQGEESWVNGVTFSADGKTIVTTSMSGPVRIWDANSGACLDILKGHPFASCSPQFSPNGLCLSTVSADGTARVWDVPGVRDNIGMFSIKQEVRSLSYFKNDKQLLVATYDSLCLYDVAKRTWLKTLYKRDSIIHANPSPKGDVIALCLSSKRLALLDVGTSKVRLLGGVKQLPYNVTFTPDGKLMAFATMDSVIHVCEVTSGKTIKAIHGKKAEAGMLIVDEQQLVIAEDSTMSVWSIHDGICLKSWRIPALTLYSISLSPDRKYVVTVNNSVADVWELATGKHMSTLKGHTSSVYASAFSPDGKYVVTTSHDTMVKLWDWRSGVCFQSERFAQYIDAQFSSDGRHVLLLDRLSKEIRIIDYPPLQELIDQTRERFKNRQLTQEERVLS